MVVLLADDLAEVQSLQKSQAIIEMDMSLNQSQISQQIPPGPLEEEAQKSKSLSKKDLSESSIQKLQREKTLKQKQNETDIQSMQMQMTGDVFEGITNSKTLREALINSKNKKKLTSLSTQGGGGNGFNALDNTRI